MKTFDVPKSKEPVRSSSKNEGQEPRGHAFPRTAPTAPQKLPAEPKIREKFSRNKISKNFLEN
jgi:hypothetical protein